MLDLWSNTLGDAGAAQLARALPGHATLSELSLGRNGVGDAGAAALAAVLGGGGCGALRQLALAWNDIGDSGADALAAALPAVPALRELNLYVNDAIGDAGADALAAAAAARADAGSPVIVTVRTPRERAERSGAAL